MIKKGLYSYVGCYVDGGTRDVNINSMTGYELYNQGTAVSKAVCSNFCKTYNTLYFALQNAYELLLF